MRGGEGRGQGTGQSTQTCVVTCVAVAGKEELEATNVLFQGQ